MSEKIYAKPQGESLLGFLGALILAASSIGSLLFVHPLFGPIIAIACFVQGVIVYALLKGFASVICLLKYIAEQVDTAPDAPIDPEAEYRPLQ